MPPEPHPWLLDIPAAPHGGDPGADLDLSVSLAPLGPSPRALAAARAAAIDTYPEPDAARLVTALSAEWGVSPDRIVPGAGAADLLLRCALAHLRPGDRALLVAPCFGEYERAIRAAGATPLRWSAEADAGWAVDTAALATAVRTSGAVVALLATPANPTGVQTSAAELRELMAATPRTRWIVDEAFIGLADDEESVRGGEAVTVRSLTKELGLAGLRVGAADAPPRVARALRVLAPPWGVSAPAIAAAVAGLADTAHRAAVRRAVRTGRDALSAALRARGLRLTDAAANFVCVQVGDSRAAVARLRAAGIAVRSCDDLGMRQGWVRIAVPPPEHLDRVLIALHAALPLPPSGIVPAASTLGAAHEPIGPTSQRATP